ATTANVAPFITKAAEEWFRGPLEKGLASAGYSSDWYHTTSADLADRRVAMGGPDAGIGRNTDGLRNAVSLLVASRGAGIGRTDLRRRVQAQVLAVSSILASAARRAGDLVKLRQFVERDIASRACQGETVIVAAPTPSEYGLRLLDPETGAVKRVTVAWESSLQLRPLKTRTRPCGYWLAASEVEAAARLQALGIVVQQFEEGGELRGQTYRESGEIALPVATPGTDTGMAVGLRVETQPTLLDVPAGSYYVSLEQPLANLVIAALEPEAPGSYPAERIVPSLDAMARVLARPTMRLMDAR
ncbi:MAG: peptidase M14, partial [Caldimonas sp.]